MARAASGGNLSLTWLLLRVIPREFRSTCSVTARARIGAAVAALMSGEAPRGRMRRRPARA
jgi:hypothetical protein